MICGHSGLHFPLGVGVGIGIVLDDSILARPLKIAFLWSVYFVVRTTTVFLRRPGTGCGEGGGAAGFAGAMESGRRGLGFVCSVYFVVPVVPAVLSGLNALRETP